MMKGVVVVGLLSLSACQMQAGGGTLPSMSSSSSSSSPERASGASTARTIVVPDVTGQSRGDAEAALRAAGVEGNIASEPDTSDFTVARVCGQVPGPGRETSSSLVVSLRYCQAAPVVTNRGHTVELVGYTVEEATKRARAVGFTGRIDVFEDAYDASCKAGMVCHVKPDVWEWQLTATMTLYINRKMTISAPE
jgi:hypothetical protein